MQIIRGNAWRADLGRSSSSSPGSAISSAGAVGQRQRLGAHPVGPVCKRPRLTAGPPGRSRHGSNSLARSCATAINAMHGPSIRRWLLSSSRPPNQTPYFFFLFFFFRFSFSGVNSAAAAAKLLINSLVSYYLIIENINCYLIKFKKRERKCFQRGRRG